jgi:SAM-dependent methyltransferase
VLDVGCGTGTLACRLAAGGRDVIAVDPAAASLAVAQTKAGADRVRWFHGDAALVGLVAADVALMTGNVAQVFLTDDAWAATLAGVHAALRPGGWLVFETRDPAARSWEAWTPEQTRREVATGAGPVEVWVELTAVALPLVSFRWHYVFGAGGDHLCSDSTLRFRSREELAADLAAAGFAVGGVRDAPDRPGLELVVMAQARVG